VRRDVPVEQRAREGLRQGRGRRRQRAARRCRRGRGRGLRPAFGQHAEEPRGPHGGRSFAAQRRLSVPRPDGRLLRRRGDFQGRPPAARADRGHRRGDLAAHRGLRRGPAAGRRRPGGRAARGRPAAERHENADGGPRRAARRREGDAARREEAGAGGSGAGGAERGTARASGAEREANELEARRAARGLRELERASGAEAEEEDGLGPHAGGAGGAGGLAERRAELEGGGPAREAEFQPHPAAGAEHEAGQAFQKVKSIGQALGAAELVPRLSEAVWGQLGAVWAEASEGVVVAGREPEIAAALLELAGALTEGQLPHGRSGAPQRTRAGRALQLDTLARAPEGLAP